MAHITYNLETKSQLKKKTELTSTDAVWPGCLPRRKDQKSFRKNYPGDISRQTS
jgi:hypothetical protein